MTGIEYENVWERFTNWSINANAEQTAQVLRYIHEHGKMPTGDDLPESEDEEEE